MKKILLALSLSGALFSAAPLYAIEESVAPAAVTTTDVAPAAATPAPFSGMISSIDGTKITVTSDQKPEDLKDGVKVEISLAA